MISLIERSFLFLPGGGGIGGRGSGGSGGSELDKKPKIKECRL